MILRRFYHLAWLLPGLLAGPATAAEAVRIAAPEALKALTFPEVPAAAGDGFLTMNKVLALKLNTD